MAFGHRSLINKKIKSTEESKSLDSLKRFNGLITRHLIQSSRLFLFFSSFFYSLFVKIIALTVAFILGINILR